MRFTDQHVGRVIARLEKEGLLENTLVIFMTDHGISHARGKQFLYDEGTHIPLVVRGPGVPPGGACGMISSSTSTWPRFRWRPREWRFPEWMQARDIFAKDYQPRDAVFAARDRCDETMERLRSVRTDKFLYIRNFHPQRPHLMPNAYKDGKAIVQTLRALQDARWQAESRHVRELSLQQRPVRRRKLYEWTSDQWQIANLAGDPAQAQTLKTLSAKLDQWIKDSGDPGSESPEVYALEIEDELKVIKPGTERYAFFKSNGRDLPEVGGEMGK